jgi:RNA polymerase sigma-70 factor (ECF subfamily)
MAQRLVRARRKIANAAIPYVVPAPEALGERLTGVLAVVYLVFNQGYSGLTDVPLASTALTLASQLSLLMPTESEVRGLLALLLFQHARRSARLDADGGLLTLEEQDRSRWHRDEIERGVLELAAAPDRGPYVLQAAIAQCHATAASAATTDWQRIVELYDELAAIAPSPVVDLNRAIAVGMLHGPNVGLIELHRLSDSLENFRLLPAARADLLIRAGRKAEAITAYEEAIASASSPGERAQLTRRLVALRHG